MKKYLAIISLVALAACDARTVEVDLDVSKATYSIDTRTHLCYASFGRAKGSNLVGNAESFSVANVPCTDDVIRLVRKGQ